MWPQEPADVPPGDDVTWSYSRLYIIALGSFFLAITVEHTAVSNQGTRDNARTQLTEEIDR